MSITLEVLGANELTKYVQRENAALEKMRGKLEPSQVLKSLFATGDPAERDGHCERSHFLRTSLNLARYEHAQGAPPTRVRAILQEAVDVYEPVVSCFDYSPFQTTFAVHVSQVKKYESGEMAHDLNEVFLAPSKSLGPRYKNVRVNVPRQPAQIEMKEALLAALCAWDFKRAESMAAAYRLNPAVKGSGPNHFGLLREAILGNTDSAVAFLENIPDGYMADFPQPRRELAEGVVRGDAALVRRGLKAVSARFKSAWTIKSYCTPAKLRRFGTIEKMMPKILDHLIWHHWTLSEWAVAWMSLAWHRGMREAFSDPNLFSEWVPWELCSPEPVPTLAAAGMRAGTEKASAKGKYATKQLLFDAVKADDGQAVLGAIAKGANIEARDLNRHTPLLAAIVQGKAFAARVLIQSGANLRVPDVNHRTPLSLAAELGHAQIVHLLLEAGLAPDETDRPLTPLIYALRGRHRETVRLLLAGGASANRWNYSDTLSPLSAAAEAGDLALVNLLLAAGATVNEPPGLSKPAIISAAKCGVLEVLERLIEAGADVNRNAAGGYLGGSALHAAAESGWTIGLATLLRAGADVNSRDSVYGTTPLHEAAQSGNQDAIKLLLASGANVNAQDHQEITPFMLSVSAVECLRLMLESGADLRLRDRYGKTVIDHAEGMPESLRLLEQYRRG